MSLLHTRPTRASVTAFLTSIPDPDRRRDAKALAALIRRVTRARPRMWGTKIVGYGQAVVTMRSGRQIDWFALGFAMRAAAITLCLTGGLAEYADDLRALGRHKVQGQCLFLPRLNQIDTRVLGRIVAKAYRSNSKAMASTRQARPRVRAV